MSQLEGGVVAVEQLDVEGVFEGDGLDLIYHFGKMSGIILSLTFLFLLVFSLLAKGYA